MNAFVGVLIESTVMYNILLEDPEFRLSGLSIINHLNSNPNLLVSKIIESQSYDGIKQINDDNVIFSDLLGFSNINIENFYNINNFINEQSEEYSFEYFYIIDYKSKMLIVKTPGNELVALDYTDRGIIEMYYNNLNEYITTEIELGF